MFALPAFMERSQPATPLEAAQLETARGSNQKNPVK
jgi:hypothetical protein